MFRKHAFAGGAGYRIPAAQFGLLFHISPDAGSNFYSVQHLPVSICRHCVANVKRR